MALLKSREVFIDPEDPWQGDPFSRQIHGERLLALIRTLRDQPYVIALNGDWGTGKSVFLRRLQSHLERAGPRIPCIRIDAWASDDAEDPLIPFVAAVQSRLSADGSAQGKTRTGLVKAASKLAVPTAALGASLVAPGSGSAIGAAARMGSALIEWELARATSTQQFKVALEKARDILTARKSAGRIETPLVIAIDELDRCRPDFSIRALERIKHFFNIPGVVFLIATDRGNLPSAVRSVYGDSVDGELYLRKFFDYEYRLPPPTAIEHFSHLWYDYEMEQFLTISDNEEWPGAFEEGDYKGGRYWRALASNPREMDALEYSRYFVEFSTFFGLSLRDQSQAFTMLAAHIRTSNRASRSIPVVDCLLVCLRFFNLKAFDDLRNRRLSLTSISTDYPEAVRQGLAKVAACDDSKALVAYLGSNTAADVDATLAQHIGRAESQKQWLAIPPLERMRARVRSNKVPPAIYLDSVLMLVHSFMPEPAR